MLKKYGIDDLRCRAILKNKNEICFGDFEEIANLNRDF